MTIYYFFIIQPDISIVGHHIICAIFHLAVIKYVPTINSSNIVSNLKAHPFGMKSEIKSKINFIFVSLQYTH